MNYLQDNLLEDDEPEDLSFELRSGSRSSPLAPAATSQHNERDNYGQSQQRLVVAIDYGTTFTGKILSAISPTEDFI